MGELWIGLAVMAALSQTLRNALTQRISSDVSPALNSWSRFAFCLPWAALACVVFAPDAFSFAAPARFFGLCALTAATQLLGSVALIAAFRRGGFGEAIVFHKLEVVLTAVAGTLFFAERPSLLGASGIAICAVGVIGMNLAREGEPVRYARALRIGPAGSYALLCAVLLVAASFALKEANALLLAQPANPSTFAAAIQTLFHTTWIEVALLTAWIVWREPASFHKVGLHRTTMIRIGTASFVGSLGWFWAYSLTFVAYVKAVGQIEAILAVALGIRLMGERELIRQLPGIGLVVGGILFVLLG